MGDRRESPILAIDQLPESRRAILVALKQRGPSTIAQFAEILGLTGEAVRQQLLQLQRDGWVETRMSRRGEPARTGRPATTYRLSQSGDHLFPKHYAELNVLMIDTVAGEFGEGAVVKMLERLADERVAAVEPSVRGLPLGEKVAAMKSWYLADDPFMDPGADDNGWRLVERNCPFLSTALRRPMLCSITVNALSRVLGNRVVREEKFQNGDGRCIFRVLEDEPVDAATYPFQLESKVTP